jgi:hypothetical protein
VLCNGEVVGRIMRDDGQQGRPWFWAFKNGGSGLGFRARLTYILVMLRMRKKPPEGLPTINAGKPWSADDLADLEGLLHDQRSPRKIAEYLGREVLEVEAKIAEREL